MKSNIYISRNVLNTQDILDWARECGFETMMPEHSLHVTVVYCSKEVDWSLVDRDQPEMIFNPNEDEDEHTRAVHNFNGGACVLEVEIPELTERNEELRKLGIHSKFPDYRAHITITYNKPKWMKVKKVKPYKGCIVLGPEKIEPASNDWKEGFEEVSLTEPSMVAESVSLDPDALYDMFSASYIEATGSSWSKEKFLSRSANWKFYGNNEGFVAVREQASGMRKLVGVAGETSGIVQGLKQLQTEGKPVWGAVSDKLARASKRFGFIAPHTIPGGKIVVKSVIGAIPSNVFGGITPKIEGDGGVILAYNDVGDAKKYFIANRQYFGALLKDSRFLEYVDSKLVLGFIKKLAGLVTESAEKTPFEKWFGQSKVVDEKGNPLVVYHGGTNWRIAPSPTWFTDSPNIADGYADQGFEEPEIKPCYLRIERPLDLRSDAVVEQVFPNGFGEFVHPAIAHYKPSILLTKSREAIMHAIEFAKSNGYDGVIHPDSNVSNKGSHTSYVVFDSHQVKAAKFAGWERETIYGDHHMFDDGNDGNYSDDHDIRK